MVQIGKIEYAAEVTGADEAESKTESLTDSYAGMGEQATGAAEDVGFLGGTLSTAADESKDAEEAAADADTEFTLLQNTIEGIQGGIGELLGTAGLSGIGGLIQGGVALGSLVKGASFATLVKGAASLGALIIAADTITDIIEGKAPLTAFVDSTEDFGELVLNPIGIENDLVEGVAGLGVFIAGAASIASFITGVSISTMITGAGAKIATFLGVSSLTSLVTGAGATIASFLGGISLTALVAGVGSIAALIFGVISLGDLVDGDISRWNLPGRFGAALGEGFRRAWPDMAERIYNAFTNNPVYAAGEFTGEVIQGQSRGGVQVENGGLSANPETGFIDPRDYPFGQSGGRVGETGLAVIHENEQLIDPSTAETLRSADGMRSGGGGGGDVTSVTVENITMEMTGDFDPSNVTRRQLSSLASRLTDVMGDKTNRRAGVR